MSKQFWAIIAIIIVVIGGAVVISNRNKDSSPAASVTASSHTKGSDTSTVKLVEYGDFQCPACFSAEPLTAQVVEKYKDQIQFQFRNFPLTSIHPNAFAGSRAAEAAAKQGKFWEMHDALYGQTNYLQWAYVNGAVSDVNPIPFFQQYAKAIGLNVDQYNKDFASSAVNNVIQADLSAGRKLNITGTPTYFLNGQQITERPTDIDGWSKLIDAALAAKK